MKKVCALALLIFAALAVFAQTTVTVDGNGKNWQSIDFRRTIQLQGVAAASQAYADSVAATRTAAHNADNTAHPYILDLIALKVNAAALGAMAYVADAPSDGAAYFRKSGAWVTGAGTGDVTGPDSSTDGAFALFDGTTGKKLKAATFGPTSFAAAAHSHAISDVTGLQTALDAKQTTITATGILKGTGSAVTAAIDKVDYMSPSAVADSIATHNVATDAHADKFAAKADKVSGATAGHLAALDANGQPTDSGVSASGVGSLTYTAITASTTQTATGLEVHYTGTSDATYTLMSAPAAGSKETWVYNDSARVLSITPISGGSLFVSGSIFSTGSPFYLMQGNFIKLSSNGQYWHGYFTQKIPNIADQTGNNGKLLQIKSDYVINGLAARWTLENTLSDTTGSHTLTNSGLTFSLDSNFPLGSRYVAYANNTSATFAATGLPSGSSNRTMCIWVKPTSDMTACSVLSYGGDGYYTTSALGLWGDGVNKIGYIYNYGTLSSSTSAITNAWNHIAITINGSSVNFYLNGAFIETETLPITLNTSLSSGGRIGAYVMNGNYPFIGYMADGRIYDRVLSLSEIQSIYTGETGLAYTPSSYSATEYPALTVKTLSAATTVSPGYSYRDATGYTLTFAAPTSTPAAMIEVINQSSSTATTLAAATAILKDGAASASTSGTVAAGTSKTFRWDSTNSYWVSSPGAGGISSVTGTTPITATTSGSGVTLAHADSGATAGTYGVSGSSVPSVTIDAKGHVTYASSWLTSLITSVGTITTGTWNGTAVGVAYGGTGSTTAAGARTNLGAAASGTNSDITSLSGLTTALSIAQGGTGGATVNAARTNLNISIPTDGTVSVNAQTGTSYTFVLADAGKLITSSNSSAQTITIPLNSSVAFSTGTLIAIDQVGAGTTTVAAASGVTLNGTDGYSIAITAQYKGVVLKKIDTNTWIAQGAF